MKKFYLTPEEKLFCAIFGETSWPRGDRHFLSAKGAKAVNDVLEEFVANPARRPSITTPAAERGIRVIRLRYGFEPATTEEKSKRPRTPWHDSPARSLGEVSVYFGVTRERIRQIEAKALRWLRHPSRSRKLKDYLRSDVNVQGNGD